MKEACVGAGNPMGSQITEEQCAPGWQLPFEALQAQHPHSPLPHLPGLCPLPGEPFCPNLSQTFRSSHTSNLPHPANSPCFLLPFKILQPGSPGILPSPRRLLSLWSNPRSTWVDQNPGPWVSPSYNGVIFSSPWPRHAPWLAAVGYLPLPRAATASRSQPSNGPRLPSPGRQGQGAGVQEAAQPPPLLPV